MDLTAHFPFVCSPSPVVSQYHLDFTSQSHPLWAFPRRLLDPVPAIPSGAHRLTCDSTGQDRGVSRLHYFRARLEQLHLGKGNWEHKGNNRGKTVRVPQLDCR